MTSQPSRPHALIGHTGFVGGNLLRQHRFDASYNSSNIRELTREDIGLLVCAGAPAAKWKANADPAGDLRNLETLMGAMKNVRASFVVLISTVDVFKEPVAVDESHTPTTDGLHAYGRHRLMLEEFVRGRFASLIVRLPALYGHGLKKNAIFDLLHRHELEKIDSRNHFQFYGLDRVWADVSTAIENALGLVHLPTEPVAVRDIARRAFGIDFRNELAAPPARYDMWTRHATVFGGRGHYLESHEQVLNGIARFVSDEQSALDRAAET